MLLPINKVANIVQVSFNEKVHLISKLGLILYLLLSELLRRLFDQRAFPFSFDRNFRQQMFGLLEVLYSRVEIVKLEIKHILIVFQKLVNTLLSF